MINMKYQGSKNRHAKEILPIILKDRTEGQYFYDLFCGGMNLIDKVDGNRIANDKHFYLIEMWKALQEGWIPPREISKCDYDSVKNNPELFADYLIGYIGFNGSYNGKYFGGYAGNVKIKDGSFRNYPREAYNNIIKQLPSIRDIIFSNKPYDEVALKPNSIIYCDIPYKNTTKYKTGDFDYDKFYQWCIEKHNEGHQVFISEYYMPEDKFECVWKKEVNSSLTKDTGSKKNIEKLFIIR